MKQPDILNRGTAKLFQKQSVENAQIEFLSDTVVTKNNSSKFDVLQSNHVDVVRFSEICSSESTYHDIRTQSDSMILPNSFSIPGPESCV